jgi:hypothetical protein
MALVVAFLIGCAVLLGVGCAGGVRSEAPKEEQQERTEATRAKGRSPEATASEEVARCEGTRTFQAQGGPFTTNDLPGCPKGGLLAGTDKADKLDGKDGDDEIRSLGGADGLISGGAGNDVIYGGPGDDDPLWGAEGNDVVYGGDGDDGLEDSLGWVLARTFSMVGMATMTSRPGQTASETRSIVAKARIPTLLTSTTMFRAIARRSKR